MRTCDLKAYQQLEQVAPPCPCGGKFEFWVFVKCPHCRQEFPYNAGVRNLKVRLNEDHLIILAGALVLGDSSDDTYRIICEPEPPGGAALMLLAQALAEVAALLAPLDQACCHDRNVARP